MMCIPYLYTSAICHFFACLMSNVKIYAFEDTLLPSDLKKNILKKKVNYFGGPPLHSKWIVDFIKNKNYNFEKLISSGDFLDNLTIDKYLYKRFKFSFFYMYGISEVGGRLCINLIKNNKYKYSVGKPLNYMKFAKNASSQSEILVKSDFLYYGYYTKKRFLVQKGKIYHTGDMGSIKEGNLILSGRTSEIFKSGGIMVYPQLIYNELIKTKWFKEVFIFKGYDKSFGNIPICVFSSSINISIKKILEYLKKKVSKEQIPRKIYRVKEFPRLGNKKIDKLSIINTFNQ